MKTIVEGNPNITKLLGKQRLKDTPYRMMMYVLRSECEDGVLLHNVVTGKMILLDAEEAPLLDKDFIDQGTCIASLIEDYYLVPEGYDEKAVVRSIRQIHRRLFSSHKINSFLILPTTDCNARCYYCFENNLRRLNMNSETVDKLLEYIVENKGEGTIHLGWFGGEPLLGADTISKICEQLAERGVGYYSTMVSNGYLFTEELVSSAKSIWKLRNIQITLDGTEEVYNKTKAYVGISESAFKRVLRNIGMLLDAGIVVVVRLNLDLCNGDNLRMLAKDLRDLFPKANNLQVYVSTIQKDTGYSPICRTTTDEAKVYHDQVELSKYLLDLGLARPKQNLPSLKSTRCMADNDALITVYPDGKIYKCENITEEDSIGSIFTSDINEAVLKKYRETIEFPECNTCVLYPSCILLKRCPANEAYNQSTCKYEVTTDQEAMRLRYRNFKENLQNASI